MPLINFTLYRSQGNNHLMEITQIMDITVAEVEHQIKSFVDFSSYPYSFHLQPTEYFPFSVIEFHEGAMWNSKVTRIFIRDNTQGGAFVITTQFFSESIGGFGARFRHYISTLMIINEG